MRRPATAGVYYLRVLVVLAAPIIAGTQAVCSFGSSSPARAESSAQLTGAAQAGAGRQADGAGRLVATGTREQRRAAAATGEYLWLPGGIRIFRWRNAARETSVLAPVSPTPPVASSEPRVWRFEELAAGAPLAPVRLAAPRSAPTAPSGTRGSADLGPAATRGSRAAAGSIRRLPPLDRVTRPAPRPSDNLPQRPIALYPETGL